MNSQTAVHTLMHTWRHQMYAQKKRKKKYARGSCTEWISEIAFQLFFLLDCVSGQMRMWQLEEEDKDVDRASAPGNEHFCCKR